MSDYEMHRGTLKKIELPKETSTSDFAKNILIVNNVLIKADDDPLELLIDWFSYYENRKDIFGKNYFYHEKLDTLYYIEDIEEDFSDNMCEASVNNNTITYLAKFYNSGTCLKKMLEEKLEELNDQNKLT